MESKLKVEVGVAKKSSKRAVKDALRVGESDEEVIVTEPRAKARQWRPVGPRPFSLSVAVTPRILEVFTSEKGSKEPKQVFFVGESIQWNIIHRVDPFVKVPYNRTAFLQRFGLGSFADDAAHVESVFPIEASQSTNKNYEFQATWSRWWLDAVPPFSGAIGPALPSQIVDGVARGQFGLIAHPGIWKMTGMVTIRSNVQRAFDVQDGWHYEIVGNPRQDH